MGQIGVFCSGGEGALPEFVCEDTERTDSLAESFDRLPAISASRLLCKIAGQAEKVARTFSGKGLFYFDAEDRSSPGIANLHCWYTKASAPLRPLYYNELSEPLKILLQYNFLEVDDFSKVDTITIKDAYESYEKPIKPGHV